MKKKHHQIFVSLVSISALQITAIISVLNFQILKLKLIITFDIIAEDNF